METNKPEKLLQVITKQITPPNPNGQHVRSLITETNRIYYFTNRQANTDNDKITMETKKGTYWSW